MSGAWYRLDPARGGFTLSLHIQPNAARTRVIGLHGDALKIAVAAPAVENKANAALTAFLSEAFGVAQSGVVLKQGSRGRKKIVEIRASGIGPEALLDRT